MHKLNLLVLAFYVAAASASSQMSGVDARASAKTVRKYRMSGKFLVDAQSAKSMAQVKAGVKLVAHDKIIVKQATKLNKLSRF